MKLFVHNYINWAGIFAILLVSSCSSLKQISFSSSNDINLYKTVQISTLSVISDKNSKEADNEIKDYYQDAILETMESNNIFIMPLSTLDSPSNVNILVVDCEMHIHYGSRTLRHYTHYFGEGRATLTLTAKDKQSGDVKYNDVREVKLRDGMYGGSFEKKIKEHISRQVRYFAKIIRQS